MHHHHQMTIQVRIGHLQMMMMIEYFDGDAKDSKGLAAKKRGQGRPSQSDDAVAEGLVFDGLFIVRVQHVVEEAISNHWTPRIHLTKHCLLQAYQPGLQFRRILSQ
jgi:hypothetical protein